MPKKLWINYTTFARDIQWMDFTLRSVRKYGRDIAGITVVVPTVDHDKFIGLEKKYSVEGSPLLIKTFLEYPEKGFVHHLAMKCYADAFNTDATHILHMDPDCMFHAPFSTDDYIIDNKPVLLIEPYDVLRAKHTGRYHWKSVTEAALQFDCPYETMCRHPAVHPAWLYQKMRTYIEHRHQTPFIDFVIKQKNSYPMGFGEFNTLGAFAYKFFNSDYHWIDRGDRGEAYDPEPKLTQFWSYHGPGPSLEKINKILS